MVEVGSTDEVVTSLVVASVAVFPVAKPLVVVEDSSQKQSMSYQDQADSPPLVPVNEPAHSAHHEPGFSANAAHPALS